jgi:NADH dehydrogenase FAD-containing subunit
MTPERISKKVTLFLQNKTINVLINTKIIEVTNEKFKIGSQQSINHFIIVWDTGVKAYSLSFTHTLELNRIHQFKVHDKLQVANTMFAFGDCACYPQIDRNRKT